MHGLQGCPTDTFRSIALTQRAAQIVPNLPFSHCTICSAPRPQPASFDASMSFVPVHVKICSELNAAHDSVTGDLSIGRVIQQLDPGVAVLRLSPIDVFPYLRKCNVVFSCGLSATLCFVRFRRRQSHGSAARS